MVAETVVAVPVVAEIGGEEMKTVEDTSHHFHILGKLTRGDLLTIGLTGTGHSHLGLTGAMGHNSLGLLPLGLGHGSLGPRHPAHIQQQPINQHQQGLLGPRPPQAHMAATTPPA